MDPVQTANEVLGSGDGGGFDVKGVEEGGGVFHVEGVVPF